MQNLKNKLKKISIIGTAGIPANYGGFETLVNYITKDLNQNFNITVYCSTKSYPNKLVTYNDCKLHYINLKANGIQSILYDIRAIFHAIKYADILLILGVSGCIVLPFIKLFSKKKIIVNIDGLEWKRQKWSWLAKMVLKLSERFAISTADAVIADNKAIRDYVKQTYRKKAHLISYGGDHCIAKPPSQKTLKKYLFLNAQYAFKVCRIEPENNVEIILEAFAQSNKIPLVLIGNWSNSNFGIEMRLKYDSISNIYLLDPIYDQSILDQIRSNCEIYVHGHSAGGTNPSLVEAMSLGLPTLCFDVNYNIETTENAALYFKSSDDLINLIKSTSKVELKQIGLKMKNIALKRYKWSIISKQYEELFNIILD
jgi:glycosyltransferase involved in cell wall biosynthesis